MLKKLIIIAICIVSLYGNNNNKTFIKIDSSTSKKTVFITHNTFRILNFSKTIKDIRLSSSDILGINFENSIMPLSKVKVFAKKSGIVNMLVKFLDNSIQQINFHIIDDIRSVRMIIKSIAPDMKISQVKDSIILKGKVETNKIKNKILALLKDTLPNLKVVDLLKTEYPDKMVRLKLYIAEINNNEGETIKNNWSLSNYNNGKNSLDITSTMLNSVTLSGGIAAVANRLGTNFNTGLTLNYLKTNGVANILDETTLITLENKESEFLAGGNLLIETSTTSKDGQPVSAIEKFPYGLELKIIVKNIVDSKFITLEIDTKSSTLDYANGVGVLPATQEKSIKTNVVVEDEATIVLGGLINNTNSKDWEKIPLLGDIPILGKLFQSKAFKEGKSELVFFITPTIVSAQSNDQNIKYTNIKNKILKIKDKNSIKKEIKPKKTKSLTNEELHKKRLKEIFGI